MTRVAPYGTWSSPISLDALVEDAVSLSFPVPTERAVYWTERRPSEGGRQTIVRAGDGAARDVLGPDAHVRSLVHEYGGLSFAVADGTVLFVSLYDQRLWRVTDAADPEPVTPEPPRPGSVRYGAPVAAPDARHIFAVRERHAEPDVPAVVVNDVVAIPLDGGEPFAVAEGHDFYAHVTTSPDGGRLCWVSWDHPSMPWDATELWEAELGEDRRVVSRRLVAGGPHESVTQPQYSPDGDLLFVSDRTGWWNLYAAAHDGGADRPLAPMEADLGEPDWVLGLSSYAVLCDGTVVATWTEGGLGRLGIIGLDGTVAGVDTPWTSFGNLRAVPGQKAVTAVVGSASEAPSVVRLTFVGPAGDVDGDAVHAEVLRRSRLRPVDERYISVPEPVEFPTEGGLRAHGLFYAPQNPDFDAPATELPPLIVASHGGPTSRASSVLDYGIQFWTSRGFGVVSVNYGGSTGYGRAYRERLKGGWGVVDVDDCVNAARFLVEAGRADPARLVIHGASAGGYTTLCALTFRDVFSAGASYYGVGDAAALARDTHKFESRYCDGLIGRWPADEAVYRARSPLFHTETLHTPMILFQGLLDKVVPPAQAEAMAAALDAKQIPYAYVALPDEDHGFRRAESIKRTAEAELYFYGRVLGFSPAGDPRPVVIAHEDRLLRP